MLDEKTTRELIEKGRRFMHGHREDDINVKLFESDQDRGLPMPPLVKAPMRPEDMRTALPRDFSALPLSTDLAALIGERKSSRVYTRENMTLTQLSFLLWATQGVKGLRGKGYATLRTVPSGGARHEFETYLAVANVEGLVPGIYHYLPMEHALELLYTAENVPSMVIDMVSGQKWAGKANVTFFWTMEAYRAEWRYGITSHRVALIDAGHICQNLYIACTGLGLGTCGIAAFSHDLCTKALEIDGENEYAVYCAPVGTVNHANDHAEGRRRHVPRVARARHDRLEGIRPRLVFCEPAIAIDPQKGTKWLSRRPTP